MKRQNRNQAISNQPIGTAKKRSYSRTGMGLLLSAMLLAGSAGAQTVQAVKTFHYTSTNVGMSGYIMERINPNAEDEGLVVAGNYNNGEGIHFGVLDNQGNMLQGRVYQFPESEDVRAISLVPVNPGSGTFLLTIQGRSAVNEDHEITLLLDLNGTILDKYDLYTLSAYGKHIFPMSSVVKDNQLYTSGYITVGAAYIADPLLTEARVAYVAKTDLVSHVTMLHLYNSTINTTPVSNAAWNGLFNDYDAAMRLKVIDNRLYVLGSANGSALMPGGGSSINASKSWVSELDPNSLSPITTTYFGNDDITGYPWYAMPSHSNGTFALDLVPDTENNDGFYCLSTDIYESSWRLSHLSGSLDISTGNFNTIAYASNFMKGHALFNARSAGNRFTVYGTIGSHVPLVDPNGYNVNGIMSPSDGAVPFVMGMFLSYDAVNGVAYTALKGSVLGNAPYSGAGLGYQSSLVTKNGSMGDWCNLLFGTAYDPGNNQLDNVALMGHYGNNGYANPRYIGSDGEGLVSNCPGSWYMDVETNAINLSNAPVNADDMPEQEMSFNYSVNDNFLFADYQLDCSASSIYRTAKPGTALQENVAAKGLYPNPATDRVTVLLGSDATDGAAVKVVITDVTGRVVLSQDGKANGGNLQLALPRLTAGMYQASVSLNQGKPAVYKLIIQ